MEHLTQALVCASSHLGLDHHVELSLFHHSVPKDFLIFSVLSTFTCVHRFFISFSRKRVTVTCLLQTWVCSIPFDSLRARPRHWQNKPPCPRCFGIWELLCPMNVLIRRLSNTRGGRLSMAYVCFAVYCRAGAVQPLAEQLHREINRHCVYESLLARDQEGSSPFVHLGEYFFIDRSNTILLESLLCFSRLTLSFFFSRVPLVARRSSPIRQRFSSILNYYVVYVPLMFSSYAVSTCGSHRCRRTELALAETRAGKPLSTCSINWSAQISLTSLDYWRWRALIWIQIIELWECSKTSWMHSYWIIIVKISTRFQSSLWWTSSKLDL